MKDTHRKYRPGLILVTIMLGCLLPVMICSVVEASYQAPKAEAGYAYVTLSANQIALIDREQHIVVDSVDIESMGCSGPWRARMTPSGSRQYVLCNGSSSLVALNLPDLTSAYSLTYPGGAEDDIVFTQDESYGFISSRNQTSIQVLDIQAKAIIKSIPLEGNGIVTSLDVSPTGDRIYAAGSSADGGTIYVIDPRIFEVVTTINFGSDVWDVAAAPDNDHLYASDRWGNGIAIIDADTFEIADVITGTGELTGLALAVDGTSIYAGREFSGYVSVYKISSHELLKQIWTGGIVRDLTMDCTGAELYVAPNTDTVSVINTRTNDVDFSIPMPTESSGVAICPQYLANISGSKSVDHDISHPGELLNYTITAQNLITESISNVTILDTLPISLTYDEGSLYASSGEVNYQEGVITWAGSINPSAMITVSFDARISPHADIGSIITNQATISAEGVTLIRSASTKVERYRILIPCVQKPCPPIYYDNFSNPGSGWDSDRGEDWSVGYQNGGYYITTSPGWIAWSLRDFGVGDYSVEVDTWPNGGLDGGAGIMFGVSNNGFYMFEVSDGWYSLWRTDIYGNYWYWTPLIEWNTSPMVKPGYQTNHLKVLRIGGNIQVFVNGQMLGNLNDWTYRGTWMGMVGEAYSTYFDGRFDNFILYGYPCLEQNSAGLMDGLNAKHGAFFTVPGVERSRPLDWRDK